MEKNKLFKYISIGKIAHLDAGELLDRLPANPMSLLNACETHQLCSGFSEGLELRMERAKGRHSA